MKKIVKWLPFFALYIPFRVCSLFGRSKKKLMLFGTSTGLYHDSCKYLFEYALSLDRGEYEVYWVCRSRTTYSSLKARGLPCVKRNTLRAAYLASRAHRYFISSELFDVFYYINKYTTLVQLYHGTAIKKIGYDTALDHPDLAKKERYFSANYLPARFDYVITESEEYNPIYESAFRVEGRKVRPLGLPRNAPLRSGGHALRQRVRSEQGLSDFKKILLYAPTYRDVHERNSEVVNALLTDEAVDFLHQRQWCLLLKLHPFFANGKLALDGAVTHARHPNVRDLSSYEDAQELLCAADVLISDYSSCILDFSLTGKPIFLFIPDLDEYRSNRGGFYATFDTVLKVSKVIESLDDTGSEWRGVEVQRPARPDNFLEILNLRREDV